MCAPKNAPTVPGNRALSEWKLVASQLACLAVALTWLTAPSFSAAQAKGEVARAILPDAPVDARVESTAGFSPAAIQSAVPSVRDFVIEQYHKPKIIDREFIILNSLTFISNVADSEISLHGLNLGLRESNPILGSHPSREAYYALGVSNCLAALYLSYHFKRVSPGRGWWKAFPVALTTAHTFGAVYSAANIYGR